MRALMNDSTGIFLNLDKIFMNLFKSFKNDDVNSFIMNLNKYVLNKVG